jgi:hypothetical protein
MRPSRWPAELTTHTPEGTFDRQDVLFFLMLAYLGIVLVPALLVALLLLVHVPTPWMPAQAGLLAVLAGLYWIFLRRLSVAQKFKVLGVFIGSSLLVLLAAGFLYDVGWDGITYHSEAILGLLHGVNPIYATFDGNFSLFTNHYPKTEWYFAAAIGGAFHRFELGKSYDLFLILACFVYSWRFFRSLRLDRPSSLLLAAGTALTPVAASQILSFYVDGAMASLMSLLILSSIAQLGRPTRLDRTVLAAVAAAAFATKFTGAAYVCVTLFLLLIALLLLPTRSSWSQKLIILKPMLATAALFAVATLVLGYSPYVTNVLEGHSPGYPATGKDKVSVIAGDTQGPREFFLPNRNRFENFAASFIATSSQAQGAQSPTPKIPFTVRASEIKASVNPDVRMAGWGVFFSGIFLASLMLYLYTRGWQWNPTITGFGILLVLATTFTNPYAYWARLAPQIGLIPILLLISCFAAASNGVRLMARCIGILFLVNSLLFAGLALQSSVRGTLRARRSFKSVYAQCGPGDYSFDDSKTMIRYDMLPQYRGVAVHPKKETAADLVTGVNLPIGLLADSHDTLHIDHCAASTHP